MSTETLGNTKPVVTKNSSEFKLDSYVSIPAGELVVFAVQVLQVDAAPVAVEEVVSTCFRFFPHSFALKNYFYWPDSALVSRRLHDAREKGLLKGSPAEGYEAKVKGRQAAKHVAKSLGVILPVPPKVEVPAPIVEKKEEISAPLKVETPVVQQEKVEVKPKKTTPRKIVEKKQVKKPVIKKPTAAPKVKAKPEKKKVAAPVKKKPSPAPNKVVKPAAKVKVQVKPVQKKIQVIEEKAKPPVKALKKERVKAAPKPKVQKTNKPTQLTMSLTTPAAWKKAQAPVTKPKPKELAPRLGDKKPVKVVVSAPVAVSKEEKDKATKVIKQLERSDAYLLYRRNGKRAQIGEFDFRNMLFATMESSAETLKRNVELFKRYAGILFRTDLIAFLEFCEEHFASLLISKKKQPLRK